MTTAVVVEFTASEARLWRAQQKLIEQEVKLTTGYTRMRKESKRAGDTAERSANRASRAAGRQIAQLRQMATSYFGVQQAIMLVNQALEEQNRLQQEAKQTTLTVGQSQAAVIKNLGLDRGDPEIKAFLQRIEQIQRQVGFESVAQLNQAASSILSASGGDQQQTIDVLRQAAIFMRDQPEEIATFGGAIADVMRSTEKDARGALAFALSVQGQARITSLSALKEVSQALAGGRAVSDASPLRAARESGALFAGLGLSLSDPEGAQTRTAVAALETNLKNFVPEAKTTFDRLQKVWADNTGELANDIANAPGYRGFTREVIRKMLLEGENNKTARQIQTAFGEIRADVRSVDRMAAALSGSTAELRAVGRAGRARGIIEQAQAGSIVSQRGEVADIVNSTLQQVGFGGLGGEASLVESFAQRQFRRAAVMFSGSTPESGIRALQTAIRPPESAGGDARMLQEINRQNALLLRSIQVLESIRDEQIGRTMNDRARQQSQQRRQSLSTE